MALVLQMTRRISTSYACFGQSVRAVGDPPDHRLSVLRPATTFHGSRVSFLLCAGASPQLSLQFLRGLPNPFGQSRAVTEAGRDTIPPGVTYVLRGDVLAAIGVVGLGDHASHTAVKPFLAVVGVDRGVRGDLRPVDRDRAEPAQARLGSDHQHLREQVAERIARLGAESGDCRVVGAVLRTQHPKRHVGNASRNGTNSLQTFSHTRMIAGYWAPHLALKSTKRSLAAASVGAV